MQKHHQFRLITLLFFVLAHVAHAQDFAVGAYSPKPGPQQAPLGQVELSKKEGNYYLRFQMAGQWQDVGLMKPMTDVELKGALGLDPSSVAANGLSNGFVAFISITPKTKIRGHSIQSGIVLISPAFGPSGTAELEKKK
ncbi:MAG: hypothetical protein H7A55_08300 [Verrucomicrobiaceae bacterium]|nr:hypothetical protein [Verrucomicrobiaceae bacterium]